MRKALIVGIDDYNYPLIPLCGCVNDASELASIIETNGDGSSNFEVRFVANVQTKAQLKSLIDDLFKGDADTALFYFAGHGLANSFGGYIVTPDHQIYDDGVSMNDILVIANESKIRNKIIILDCCHSGAMGSPEIAGGNICFIKEGVSILTASKKNEPSLETNGHGVFTNLLLEALQGGAADIRGRITPGSVYSYIDQALGAWDQRPVFKTNISQFTVLRKVTPHVPDELLRKMTEYFSCPTEEFMLDPSFEDTNSTEIKHEIKEPCANPENVEKFKHLRKFQSVGLVTPVGEDYMYFAAMNSKSCKLTALGYHYWRLVKDKRLY